MVFRIMKNKSIWSEIKYGKNIYLGFSETNYFLPHNVTLMTNQFPSKISGKNFIYGGISTPISNITNINLLKL